MKKNYLIISVLIFFLLVSCVSAATSVKELTIDGDYPWIRIDRIGERYVGEQFTISGTTNLPVDDNFIFEAVSSSYIPGVPNNGEYSGLAETIKVVKGDPYNEWSVDIDTSSFKPDEYTVNVESVETTSTATTSFDLLEKGAAATTIKTATATITVPPTTSDTTTVATTVATTVPSTPTATAAAPGFGALVSLIALGTAAALLIRKK
jgi:PGF-CTERM protein